MVCLFVSNYIPPPNKSVLSPESQINQLQYRLDKLKEETGEQEQVARDHMHELEAKNNT